MKGYLILSVIFVIVIYLLKKAKYATSHYCFTLTDNATQVKMGDILIFKNSTRVPRVLVYKKPGNGSPVQIGVVTNNFLYHQNLKDLIYGNVSFINRDEVSFIIVRWNIMN